MIKKYFVTWLVIFSLLFSVSPIGYSGFFGKSKEEKLKINKAVDFRLFNRVLLVLNEYNKIIDKLDDFNKHLKIIIPDIARDLPSDAIETYAVIIAQNLIEKSGQIDVKDAELLSVEIINKYGLIIAEVLEKNSFELNPTSSEMLLPSKLKVYIEILSAIAKFEAKQQGIDGELLLSLDHPGVNRALLVKIISELSTELGVDLVNKKLSGQPLVNVLDYMVIYLDAFAKSGIHVNSRKDMLLLLINLQYYQEDYLKSFNQVRTLMDDTSVLMQNFDYKEATKNINDIEKIINSMPILDRDKLKIKETIQDCLKTMP